MSANGTVRSDNALDHVRNGEVRCDNGLVMSGDGTVRVHNEQRSDNKEVRRGNGWYELAMGNRFTWGVAGGCQEFCVWGIA